MGEHGQNLREAEESGQTLKQAIADCMLDPQVLLEAVRDPVGRVVDFIYCSANLAACSILALTESELVGRRLSKTLPNLMTSELTQRYAQCLEDGQPVILDDLSNLNDIPDESRYYDLRATRAAPELLSLTWRDVTDRFQKMQHLMASEETYRRLIENVADVVCHVRDGRLAWISSNVAEVSGLPAEYWLSVRRSDVFSPDYATEFAAARLALSQGKSAVWRTQVTLPGSTACWIQISGKPFYDFAGRRDGDLLTVRRIDDQVAAEEALEEVRRQQAGVDKRFRQWVTSAAFAMFLATPEGRFTVVNDAMCELFGCDAEEFGQTTWPELTAPEYVDACLVEVRDIMSGQADSYRMNKRFVHADGHHIWGDFALSCVRNLEGDVEFLIGQITDITAELRARNNLAISEERNRLLVESLQSELGSAAKYVQAVLPDDLDGPVSVSARYLPSNTLGGDCFDFLWIDDDHMMVYLLDVSGHGVESALVAVSVHNMLRSASLSTQTLLQPDQVLAALNRQFAMERQDLNYFTIFYGVYQLSSATFTYASGGHPPALLFSDGRVTVLTCQSPPVGIFDNTAFTSTVLPVPPGSQILVCSDGAYEFRLDDGVRFDHKKYVDICTRLAGSPDWSLDDLIDQLRRLSASRSFDDDCCLVSLRFAPCHRISEPELLIFEALSAPDTLLNIRETLGRIWQAHADVPMSIRAEIAIASAEIAANIVEHAAVDRPVQIRMECSVLADEVQIRFIDDGRELDVDLNAVRLPDEMAGRGRGLAIARAVLRNLSYQRTENRNRWTLLSERFSG